jgi:hypothetical protein
MYQKLCFSVSLFQSHTFFVVARLRMRGELDAGSNLVDYGSAVVVLRLVGSNRY